MPHPDHQPPPPLAPFGGWGSIWGFSCFAEGSVPVSVVFVGTGVSVQKFESLIYKCTNNVCTFNEKTVQGVTPFK